VTHAELIEAIDRIRDELSEARRYVRTAEPDEAISKFANIGRENFFTAICRLNGLFGIAIAVNRLAGNLAVGAEFVQVDPSVLEGYIDGARFELLALRGLAEKAMRRAGLREPVVGLASADADRAIGMLKGTTAR